MKNQLIKWLFFSWFYSPSAEFGEKHIHCETMLRAQSWRVFPVIIKPKSIFFSFFYSIFGILGIFRFLKYRRRYRFRFSVISRYRLFFSSIAQHQIATNTRRLFVKLTNSDIITLTVRHSIVFVDNHNYILMPREKEASAVSAPISTNHKVELL